MLLLLLLLRACWMNRHAMLDEPACMNRHAGTGMHAAAAAAAASCTYRRCDTREFPRDFTGVNFQSKTTGDTGR